MLGYEHCSNLGTTQDLEQGALKAGPKYHRGFPLNDPELEEKRKIK